MDSYLSNLIEFLLKRTKNMSFGKTSYLLEFSRLYINYQDDSTILVLEPLQCLKTIFLVEQKTPFGQKIPAGLRKLPSWAVQTQKREKQSCLSLTAYFL